MLVFKQELIGFSSLFNLPGTILGAFAADYIGPKRTLCWGLGIQAVFGFVLAGTYPMLKNHVAGFAVMYGIFLSFGVFSVSFVNAGAVSFLVIY